MTVAISVSPAAVVMVLLSKYVCPSVPPDSQTFVLAGVYKLELIVNPTPLTIVHADVAIVSVPSRGSQLMS